MINQKISGQIFQRGFTLIEILVVIAIMMILIGGSIAGFSGFNQKAGLIAAGQNMKNALRDAQSRAYTGEFAGCPTPPNSLAGWQVDLKGNTMTAICVTPASQPAIRYDLKATVTISANPTGVMFTTLQKGTTLGTPLNICLSSSNVANQFYKITVDTSGNISDQNPLPTACP